MSEELSSGGAENTASNESLDSQFEAMRTAEAQEQAQEPAQEEQQPKQEPEQQQESPADKRVPLAALHEARQQLKAEREARQQFEAQQRQQFQLLEQRLQQLTNPPPQVPAFEQDPGAHLLHQTREIAQNQQRMQQEHQQLQERIQQQQQIALATRAIETSEAQFIQQAPDFYESIAFLRTQRVNELVQAFGLDESQAVQRANQDLQGFAFNALQNGKNPAEVAYNTAKARGYNPQQTKLPSAAEKFAAEQRGVKASSTLNGGSASTGQMTLEALSKMSNEDFAKLKDSDWRKAMGG